MFDFREKVDILAELFGVRERRPRKNRESHFYGEDEESYDFLRQERQPGFTDEEVCDAIGRVPTHHEAKQYIVFNGAVPTTAAQVKMACTTSINTLLQVLTPSTTGITILEWGISFDNSVAGVPVNVEFFANDVAITGATAVTPTTWGIDATASLCVGGTAATCFNDGAVTEGTCAGVRMFDCQLVPPTGSYWKQWPLGREPYMPVSKALRIRTTAPAAVNAICYVVWTE